VRNKKECVCSASNCSDTEQRSDSNIFISSKISKEMPGSVTSGTLYIYSKVGHSIYIVKWDTLYI